MLLSQFYGKKEIPATIFLTTGLINTNDTVWYGRINLALSKTQRTHIEWNGFKFDLSTLDLKAKASAAIQDSLKELDTSHSSWQHSQNYFGVGG